MPLRALAKMTNGVMDMGVVDALVREVKGWGLIGLVPAITVKVLTGEGFLLVWFIWAIIPIVFALIVNLVKNGQLESQLKTLESK